MKNKTKKGGMSHPRGITCTDCLQKRRDKYHATKKRAMLKLHNAQSGTVSPTQLQIQQTQVATPSVEGSAALLGLNKEFKILSAPRLVDADLKDTLYCTSCKKEKPVVFNLLGLQREKAKGLPRREK